MFLEATFPHPHEVNSSPVVSLNANGGRIEVAPDLFLRGGGLDAPHGHALWDGIDAPATRAPKGLLSNDSRSLLPQWRIPYWKECLRASACMADALRALIAGEQAEGTAECKATEEGETEYDAE